VGSRIWPFTDVLQEIRSEVTREMGEFEAIAEVLANDSRGVPSKVNGAQRRGYRLEILL
jgi:hypothetical protein